MVSARISCNRLDEYVAPRQPLPCLFQILGEEDDMSAPGDTPDFNSSSEINASSLAMCKSTKGRPESSSRSSGASRNPSFSLYHSRDAGRFRTSIARLSAMVKGGLPHINIVLGRILAGTAKSCEVRFSECGFCRIPSYRKSHLSGLDAMKRAV